MKLMKPEFDFRVICAYLLQKQKYDSYGNKRYNTFKDDYRYLDLPESVIKPRKVRLFKQEPEGWKNWKNRPKAVKMVNDQFCDHNYIILQYQVLIVVYHSPIILLTLLKRLQ